jgi:protein ImuB
MYTSAMRIACVFVPHVPLQALVRRRPELRKQSIIVVSGGPASSVVACSRAAYLSGVRVGMTAIVARQCSADSVVEVRDLAAEAQVEAAMVESLYGLSAQVEAEGLRRGQRPTVAHSWDPESARTAPTWQGIGTIFAEVPTGMRGATFGARILEIAATLDVAVRVGIADDRFTAWVAARHGGSTEECPVVAIPRGGSAAFLAPQPLSLLDISVEVQQMLSALGVRTLGEFASLPAPSVARRWDCDLQALARGEGGAQLRPIKSASVPLREEITVGAELGLGAAVVMLAERVALRLTGRGGVAAAVEVSSHTERGTETATLWLVPPLDRAEELADRIGRALAEGPIHRLALTVTVADAVDLPSGNRNAEPARQEAVAEPAGPEPMRGGLPPEPAVAVGMAGSLARWSETGGGAAKPHRRTRRGKQRRRIVSTQARLFGSD